MADLIDHTNHSWNPGFVKPLYPYPLVKKSWTFLSKKQELRLNNLFGNTSLQVSTKLKKLITSSQKKLHSLVQTYGSWYGKLKFPWKSATLCEGFFMIVFPLFSPWRTRVFMFKAHAPYAMRKMNPHLTCFCFTPSLKLFGMDLL